MLLIIRMTIKITGGALAKTKPQIPQLHIYVHVQRTRLVCFNVR